MVVDCEFGGVDGEGPWEVGVLWVDVAVDGGWAPLFKGGWVVESDEVVLDRGEGTDMDLPPMVITFVTESW